MIEGEEEIGSPTLGKWCAENKELVKADIILVSDTGMIAPRYSIHYNRITRAFLLAG